MIYKFNGDFSEVFYISDHTPGMQYLHFPFYLNHVGYMRANEGYFLEQDGMNYYFIGLTLSGSGVIERHDGIYAITRNKAFLIDCSDYFKIYTQKGCKWDLKWLYFGGAACREYYRLINRESFNDVTMNDMEGAGDLIDEIYGKTRENSNMTDIGISMLITRLLTEMAASRYPEDDFAIKNRNMLKPALEYIRVNYTRNIKISEICDGIYMSKSHLMRIFKSYLDTTPHEYLTRYRIKKSKTLLRETQYSVNEISQITGFESASLFISNFKKYSGITPHKYRKSMMMF